MIPHPDDCMNDAAPRKATILQPIRTADAPPGGELPTDRGPLAHNPAITDIEVIAGAMTAEECARVIEIASGFPVKRGKVASGLPGYRRCDTTRVPAQEDTRWIYERIAEIFADANRRFRFDVAGLIEEILVVAYGPDDRYQWHVDCAPNFTANRKLSLSVFLAAPEEYEGGALEFSGKGTPPDSSALGNAVVFPAFLAHRVAPVTRGTRIALVAFAYGPTFR